MIARIAACGSPTRAAQQMGKNVSGAEGVYRSPGAESFRAAWDAALALWQQRSAEAARGAQAVGRAPGLNVRGGRNTSPGLLPGQVINEFGEWEDEAALERRADEARDSVSRKLINARRLYLNEISDSPGKRAAFELLTVLPIDWERAERLQPQPDEPWRNPNMREPEMLLTAEAGWLGGELVHGPDKQAQLREAIDEHRKQEGLPPVEWD